MTEQPVPRKADRSGWTVCANVVRAVGFVLTLGSFIAYLVHPLVRETYHDGDSQHDAIMLAVLTVVSLCIFAAPPRRWPTRLGVVCLAFGAALVVPMAILYAGISGTEIPWLIGCSLLAYVWNAVMACRSGTGPRVAWFLSLILPALFVGFLAWMGLTWTD